MFSIRMIDGVQVLFRQRLADDWAKLQAIRGVNRENALKGWADRKCDGNAVALRPHATAMQVSKEVSKNINSNTKPAQNQRGDHSSEQIRKIQAKQTRERVEEAIRKETRIGQGPSGDGVHLKPEALERIRARERAAN
jgi:hypothetical protein